MGDIDVLSTLKSFENQAGTAINVTGSEVATAFGNAISTAITNIFSGSLQIGGATFAVSGTSVQASVTGTGAAPPLVEQVQVTFTFSESNGTVTMTLVGSVTANLMLSDAWSVLNTAPFNELALTSGTLSMTVDPTDESFALDVSATASYQSNPLGTGLFVVNYASSKLGFLAGFIVTSGGNAWTPFADWPVLQTLSLEGEAGLFFATITVTDLSAFKPLNLPYLPSEIDPGLTFLAEITLAGSLEPIASLLPSGTTLELLANIPPAGITQASVTATLATPVTNNAFTFTLTFTWKSTSADSGSIEISVTAVFNDGSNQIDLTGDVTFQYGSQPNLTGEIIASGNPGLWPHPFGIPNLIVKSFAMNFSLSEEGIGLGLVGTVQVGEENGNPVLIEIGSGIEDFDLPEYVLFQLSPANPNAQVGLSQLITDFIPELPNFALLNNITIGDLLFYAVAVPSVPIDGKTYLEGIGLTGDITFFGYDLDFSFSLVTNPSVAVKASGSISDNGGPIVITVAGVTVLTFSDTTGKLGPSASIDTTGNPYYFTINAQIVFLGLLSASVAAQASSSSFEFDMALGAGNIFSEQIHVEFIPDQSDFAASLSCNFAPPNITLGPWGVIPQFTIPTPQISLCLALGSIVPSAPPCSDGWLPSSAPYFRVDINFTWGPISFSMDLELEFNQVVNAFQDFESWLVSLVLNSPKAILDAILNDATKLAQLLIWLGQEILALAEYTFDKVVSIIESVFGWAYEEAFNLVSDVVNAIEQCATDIGNDALGSPIGAALPKVPQFLADLTESPNGQTLLYHYYLQKPTLDRLLAASSPTGDRCREVLALETRSENYQQGRYLATIITVLRTCAPEGDAEFQASVAEVLSTLEQHQDKSYSEFLVALRG